MFKIILIIHICFGSLALLTFWIPLVAKKGQRVHIAGGITYLTAMFFAILTASMLCLLRLTNPVSSQEQKQFAWFLLFISLLAGASGWYAIRVWVFKNRSLPHTHWLDLSIATSLLLSAIAMGIYGYHLNNTLLTYFPLIGIFLGANQLKYWLQTPTFRMHAWFEHMAGMFACVISTLTAFTVVGLPRLLGLPGDNLWVWFGPTIVLVPVLLIWQRYYAIKFNIKG